MANKRDERTRAESDQAKAVSWKSLAVKVQVIGLPKTGKSIISSIIYRALLDHKINVNWNGDEDYNLRDNFKEMDKSKFNVSLVEISVNRTPRENN